MIIRHALHSLPPSVLALALGIATLPAVAGNTVTGSYAVVAGGDQNTASGPYSAVGGGFQNTASGAAYSTVAGGNYNFASNFQSTVTGGVSNSANGTGATVGGGATNIADGAYSTISGGDQNLAPGMAAVVPGGYLSVAGGDYSFAAGLTAHIRSAADAGNSAGDHGTFMWADTAYDILTPYVSSGPNQFLVRANGGFALNGTPVNANVAMTIVAPLSNPGYASIFLRQSNSDSGVLISSGDAGQAIRGAVNNTAAFYVDQYNGSAHTRRLSIGSTGDLTVTAAAYKPGGGSWAASSDARLKTNVQPLDHALDRLLTLRGVTFEYSQPDNSMHPAGTFTGFIAQEVEPTFPNWIGHDDKGYMTVGPQGFEALTVEALRTVNTENAELRAQLDDLRQQVATLAATVNLQRSAGSASSVAAAH